jgi:hypothetical protein
MFFPIYSFHFSKNVFSKIKSKFRLAGYLRPSGDPNQKLLSHRVRQYFALPLLRPEDMYGEMQRLKNEIKELVVAHCTPKIRRAFNDLHNYIIKSWMIRYGPSEISVFGSPHKTNNILERLNKLMNEELGLHKGFFVFMNRLKTSIFETGFHYIAVANSGRQDKHKMTVAAQKLSDKALQVERDYRDGLITAADLLATVANHYDDSVLIEVLNNATDNDDTVDEEVEDQDLLPDSQETGES